MQQQCRHFGQRAFGGVDDVGSAGGVDHRLLDSVDFGTQRFRRDEPCGKTIPNTFMQAVKWIENKAGLAEELRFSSSMAFKAVVERVTAELHGDSPPIKRAPRMFARIIEEMEAYILCQDRPVYLRCIAWIRLIKVWATLRNNCHTHISLADIRFYEGRLTVTLRHSKTTGANKLVKKLPIIVSEHAYVRDLTWLERGLNFSGQLLHIVVTTYFQRHQKGG